MGEGWKRRAFRAEAARPERLRETWDALIIDNLIFFMNIRYARFFLFSVHFSILPFSSFFQRLRLTKGEEGVSLHTWVPGRLLHRRVAEEEPVHSLPRVSNHYFTTLALSFSLCVYTFLYL